MKNRRYLPPRRIEVKPNPITKSDWGGPGMNSESSDEFEVCELEEASIQMRAYINSSVLINAQMGPSEGPTTIIS